MWSLRSGEHTRDTHWAGPKPVPRSPATGAASVGYRTGDTVHPEGHRGESLGEGGRPGPGQTVLRWGQSAGKGRQAVRGPHGIPERRCTARHQLAEQASSGLQAASLPNSTARPALPVPSWAPGTASALLQALGRLHHSVAPVAHGELPAEEGRRALWLHPLDLLACGGKRSALTGQGGASSQGPRAQEAWLGLSRPFAPAAFLASPPPPVLPPAAGGGVGRVASLPNPRQTRVCVWCWASCGA